MSKPDLKEFGKIAHTIVMSGNFRSPLLIDSDLQYIGNSPGGDGRGRLHVKISNETTEAVTVSDVINSTGLQAIITVTTTPVALRVGGANLANRKAVYWQSMTGKVRAGFVGVSSTIGFRFFKDQFASLPVGPDLDFYLVAESGSVQVLIGEAL